MNMKVNLLQVLGVLTIVLSLGGCGRPRTLAGPTVSLHPFHVVADRDLSKIADKLSRHYEVTILEGEHDIIMLIPNEELFLKEDSLKLCLGSSKLMDEVASFLGYYTDYSVIISGCAKYLDYQDQALMLERAKIIETMLLARDIHGVMITRQMHQNFYKGKDSMLLILTRH